MLYNGLDVVYPYTLAFKYYVRIQVVPIFIYIHPSINLPQPYLSNFLCQQPEPI